MVVLCLAAEFDAAKHLNTHPDLLDRAHNRLTLDKLKTAAVTGSADDESLAVSVVVMWSSLVDDIAGMQCVGSYCLGHCLAHSKLAAVIRNSHVIALDMADVDYVALFCVYCHVSARISACRL